MKRSFGSLLFAVLVVNGCVASLEEHMIFSCTNDNDCPAEHVCVTIEGYDSSHICLHECSNPTDCQSGQKCITVLTKMVCVSESWCDSEHPCENVNQYCEEYDNECLQNVYCQGYQMGSVSDDSCCTTEDLCDWNYNSNCDCDGTCEWDSYDCDD